MCVYLSSITGVSAQMGIGTTTPDQSAILDLSSTEQGLLPPRLTTTERDLIADPAEGLVIYNTTDKCLQYWNNTTWKCAVGGNGDSSQSSGGMSLNYPYATKLKFKDVISIHGGKTNILLTDQGELYGCGYNLHGIISQTATTGKQPLGVAIHSPRAFKNIPAKVKKIIRASDQSFGFITEENKAYFLGQKHYLMGKYSPYPYKSNPNNGSSYIDIPERVEAVPTVHDMAAHLSFSVLVDDKGDAHYAGSFFGGNSGYNTFEKPTGVTANFRYLRVWIPYSRTVILEGNNGKYYVTAENVDKDYGLPHGSMLAKGLNWIDRYSAPTIVEMSGLPSGIKFKDFQASIGYGNFNVYHAALSEDGDIYTWGGHYYSGTSEIHRADRIKPPYEKVEPTDIVKHSGSSVPADSNLIRKPVKLKKPEGTQKYTDMHIQARDGQDSVYLLDNKVLYRYGSSSSAPMTSAEPNSALNYSSVGNSIMFVEKPFHSSYSADFVNKYQSFRELTALSGISEPQNIIINSFSGSNLFVIDKNSSLWGIGANYDHRLCTGYAATPTTSPKPMLNGNFDKSGLNDNPEPL